MGTIVQPTTLLLSQNTPPNPALQKTPGKTPSQALCQPSPIKTHPTSTEYTSPLSFISSLEPAIPEVMQITETSAMLVLRNPEETLAPQTPEAM